MSIKRITGDLLREISREAATSDRKRTNYNFHELSDPAQRFLNAIEPESYIRPHRHVNPDKDEAFLLVKGRGAVIVFSDQGDVEDVTELHPERGALGVDIPGGLYHTIVSLESGSVFYEVKAGPYDPMAAKGFAEWAPAAETPAAVEYLEWLKTLVLKD